MDIPQTYLHVRQRLDKPGQRAHAMGVCGVGVAGVAWLLAQRGWLVTGCDEAPNPVLRVWLEDAGVRVVRGHDPAHVADGCDLLIRSTAVPWSHPEVRAAEASGALVARRGEVLAALAAGRRSVAICGTHGKTTTACFATQLLRALGAHPSWSIGGYTAGLAGVAGIGDDELMVVEADESDGTLVCYEPEVTVVTNIDLDHLEHFRDFDALQACFETVAARTRGRLVCGADDPVAADLAARHPGAVTFGFSSRAMLRGENPEWSATASRCRLWWRGRDQGMLELPLPGRHNLLNALAALAAATALGYEPEDLPARMSRLDQLPGRRFEQVAVRGGARIVLDYAHHPAEIEALVSMARLQNPRRLLVLFQPHRYSRSAALGPRFPHAFAGVDKLILAPVYAASEQAVEGGRAEDLYRAFRSGARKDVPVPFLAGSLRQAWEALKVDLRAGDLLLLVGAGDIDIVAEWAGKACKDEQGRPVPSTGGGREKNLAKQQHSTPTRDPATILAGLAGAAGTPEKSLADATTLGVGGAADLWVEVEDIRALSEVLRRCRELDLTWSLLGGGSNTLVDDLGVRGVTLSLSGAAFCRCDIRGRRAAAGCGLAGAALLRRLAGAGLGGLEFMAGIPGTLGGWLAMNAGTLGGTFGERVRRIRVMEADGSDHWIDRDAAGFGYRHCRVLRNRIALEVELELCDSTPGRIQAACDEARARRTLPSGLRSAGSVFRNASDEPAGRLLDRAGCKGLSVGGASVWPGHANVIVTRAGATASDVLALAAQMRGRVMASCGVSLEFEINHLKGCREQDDNYKG